MPLCIITNQECESVCCGACGEADEFAKGKFLGAPVDVVVGPDFTRLEVVRRDPGNKFQVKRVIVESGTPSILF